MDDAWKQLLATVLGGVLAAGGGIVGQYYASKFQVSSQSRIQKIEGQREVFARLMGRKFSTTQLYVSRYEALIFSDYHETRWKLASAQKDAFDLKEARRWMHRSEDLVTEIVRNNQALNEDLGTVRALFPDTPEIRHLTKRIHEFKSIKTSQPPDRASFEEMIKWKNESVRQLQTLVDLEFGKPIEDLIEHLARQLPME